MFRARATWQTWRQSHPCTSSIPGWLQLFGLHKIGPSRMRTGHIVQMGLDKWLGLIWSDPVNPAESVGLFLSLSLFLLFPEDRASSSLGRFERRLISLIFAGRNRIIMIRRELPLTVIASPVEPVA